MAIITATTVSVTVTKSAIITPDRTTNARLCPELIVCSGGHDDRIVQIKIIIRHPIIVVENAQGW